MKKMTTPRACWGSTSVVCCWLSISMMAWGQPSQWVNAKMENRSAAAGLEKEFSLLVHSRDLPAWIGYSVPSVQGQQWICCGCLRQPGVPVSINFGQCQLEGRNDGMNFQSRDASDRSSASARLVVLLRAAQKSVGKIRVVSEDCQLDAGGLPVFWFSDARSGESVNLLASLIRARPADAADKNQLHDSALAAIAMHADPAADRSLEEFVDSRKPLSLRKSAAFWLGSAREKKGYEVLRRLLREDADPSFRAHCVFALFVSKVPEALTTLIETARNDKDPHVRGQGLFWLAQKAGEKAIDTLSNAIANDPETEVKKKAVFGLSQLPKDEAIPRLIQVARTHRNAEVRKDAMFWLGQSNDPRALAFFEEILTH